MSYYVTTPIYYVNAQPHLGHAYTTIAADENVPDLARALDALRRLVDAGAKPRPAAGVVAELTGVPANALYKALTDASAE